MMLSDFKSALEHPYYVPRKLNRLFHSRLGRRDCFPDGVEWFSEDWDVLTILDACRYDTFAELHQLPGELSAVCSRETATAHVLRANFDGRRMHDTVYVTAMPVLYNGQHDRLVYRAPIECEFHAQIKVWQDDGWDESARTVLPETMEEYALEAAARYPNKRLILHFSQPHCPFIGSFGRERFDTTKRAFWSDVMEGKVDGSKADLRRAYRENLGIVLPTVSTIMSEIVGKHVITADHGQLFGERARPIPDLEWGHPPGIYIDEVLQVPWLEYTNGRRREIESTPPRKDFSEVSRSTVSDQLADLGYVA